MTRGRMKDEGRRKNAAAALIGRLESVSWLPECDLLMTNLSRVIYRAATNQSTFFRALRY